MRPSHWLPDPSVRPPPPAVGLDDIDPAYRRLWADMKVAGIAPGDPLTMSVEQARKGNRRYYAYVAGEPRRLVDTTDLLVPVGDEGTRLRLYRPHAGSRLPVVLYFHGGGYALNGPDTHDRLMRELALASGWAVIGVQYALAPEHRFPTQTHQAIGVLNWLRRRGRFRGLDAATYALAGDSAGAHLALSTALELRGAGLPLPRTLLLAYGMYQHRFDTASHRLYGAGGFGLTTARMQWFWRNFLPEGDVVPEAAEPLRAELAGLPPVQLILAELDCLRDDTLALHARLRNAGVATRLDRYPGALHAFLQFTRILPAARLAVADMADHLSGFRCH